jgi:hypothetical protein
MRFSWCSGGCGASLLGIDVKARVESPLHLAGEERVDGGAAAHRGLADELVRALRDVELASAIGEGGDPELRIPSRLQDPRAELDPWRSSFRPR